MRDAAGTIFLRYEVGSMVDEGKLTSDTIRYNADLNGDYVSRCIRVTRPAGI